MATTASVLSESKKQEATVSELLLSELKKYGVRFICGLPAAQIAGIMDGASKSSDFTYVTTRHEEAAGHMAHAIACTTGTVPVCFGTVGPGATNLLPGVAAAWADNIPLLVITANNQRNTVSPGKDLLQNAEQLELYKPITKWNAQIRDPERAPELIRQAMQIATSGRPGPVHLDIPCDVGFMRVDTSRIAAQRPAVSRPAPDPSFIRRAAEMLRKAERPLLIAGGGVVRADGTEAFRRLLEITGFPATTTIMGNGVVPPESPNNIGCGGFLGGKAAIEALQRADVMLSVGCKFSTWMMVDKPPLYIRSNDQQLIQIEIDPNQINKNTRTDLGIVSDARLALEQLVLELQGDAAFAIKAEWKQELSRLYDEYQAEVKAIAAPPHSSTGRINEAAAARELARLIDPNAIVCFDGGQVQVWASTFIHPRDPRNAVASPGMGHLGTGLPYANGAKLAHPDRQVVLVTGDGAFGCTIQELETAVRYGLNIIVVVLNDSCWGMYRPFGELFKNPNLGINLTNVDFATVAKGFGCYSETVTKLQDLAAAFDRAKTAGKPALINTIVDYAQHPTDYIWGMVVLDGVKFPM
jgi:acetolactate synthase-1/2/3 large subunit